jgi:hypothetical protein
MFSYPVYENAGSARIAALLVRSAQGVPHCRRASPGHTAPEHGEREGHERKK